MKQKRILQSTKYFVMAVAFVLLSFCGASNGNVWAEEDTSYRLTIDKVSTQLGTIDPGKTYSDSFHIRNDGTERFKYEITYAPFTVEVKDDNYVPKFEDETKYTDIAKWISTDVTEGELDPGESELVTWKVKVPSDAHGGVQMGAILVTMDPVEIKDGTTVSISRQLAYLIYGNVDGDLITTGKILEHKVPSFLFNPPVTVSSIVENTGNVYTKAQYTLQVFPLFSDEEIYTNEEKPDDSVIYPDTKRLNQDTWEGAPSLGIFRVRSVVKIFDEESVVDKLVFLCPIWFLFLIVLIIILIIVWIVTRIMKRKNEA